MQVNKPPAKTAAQILNPRSTRRDLQSDMMVSGSRDDHLIAGNTAFIPAYTQQGLKTIGRMLTLFSPLTAYRTALAEKLETVDQQDEETQALTLQRTGRYLAKVRPIIWFSAGGLLLGLLACLSMLIAMIHTGGFADYVKNAAMYGVGFSDWVFGY
ncbi:MAG: hypothetical protein AB8B63_02945 [Granulosicoccus sp.]